MVANFLTVRSLIFNLLLSLFNMIFLNWFVSSSVSSSSQSVFRVPPDVFGPNYSETWIKASALQLNEFLRINFLLFEFIFFCLSFFISFIYFSSSSNFFSSASVYIRYFPLFLPLLSIFGGHAFEK